MERWKDVIGYEGLYQVSDQGRVKSIKRRYAGEKILKASPDKRDGRPVVCLSNKAKTRNFWVHRLVLEAFVGPCPAGHEACHWNDIRTDNNVSNLRWGTKKENKSDAKRNGRLDRMSRPIIRSDGVEYYSIRDAARCMGVSHSTIWHVLNGRYNSAGGYNWRYKS